MKKISIAVPCYNEEEVLPIFYNAICEVANKLKEVNFEFIFVNDGSSDNTVNIMRELSKKDTRVRYISFSRNFGKEAAIYAGLKAATGDYVAVMDADLQDPPELIIQMYNILETEDYDCVGTRRVTRKGEPLIRSIFSKMFYKIINKMSQTEIVDGARDFRLMKKRMSDAVVSMGEYNRFSKGIFSFVGFKTKWLEYENIKRAAGKTKWSFWKLFKYSIEGITDFSTTPLIVSALMGLSFCAVAVLFIILIIIKTLIFGDPVSGWPSLVCIILFLSGVQLFGLRNNRAIYSKSIFRSKKETYLYS